MTCQQIAPYIVDFARNTTRPMDRGVEDVRISRHLVECPACAALLERERSISAALRGLARDLKEPEFDPRGEQALLAIFDEVRARPSAHMQAPLWTGLAAAVLLFGAVVTWRFAGGPRAPGIVAPPAAVIAPEIQQAQMVDAALPIASAEGPDRAPDRAEAQTVVFPSAAASEDSEFVAWPGATAWPPFESGELIRIELPVDGGFIEADVIVGQDGFARAVRLVQ